MGKGLVSLVGAITIVSLVALTLSLFTIVQTFKIALPVVVIDSPAPFEEEAPTPPSLPQAPARNLPPPPTVPRLDLPPPVAVVPPEAPRNSPSNATLTAQSDLALVLFAEAEEAEAERLQEIAEKEALAKEKAEEEARQEAIAAEKRVREAAEQKAQAARLAAIKAEQAKKIAALQREKDQQANQARQRSALSKKVASPPSITRRTNPRYPSSAKRAGQEGTARIIATVSSSGKISATRVGTSSGFSALDSAALAAVKNWRFTPARNGLGEAIPHQVSLPITFKLN